MKSNEHDLTFPKQVVAILSGAIAVVRFVEISIYVVSFLGTHKKNFISHLHLNKQQSGEYEYLTNTYELQLNYSLL